MTPHDLIDKGYFLFPINHIPEPDSISGKLSRRPHVRWRRDSSTARAHIDNWLRKWPSCWWGIDCGKSGLLVIDDDRGKNPLAEASLDELQKTCCDIPDTYIVKTKSNGYHYYFRGVGRNSASTSLGRGLDTRGEGGYVVAPCSPGYSVEQDSPVADLPQPLAERIGKPYARGKDRVPDDIILDKPADVARAINYLKAADVAVEGCGGNLQTFTTSARVRDLGISEDMAVELMLSNWNDRCSPPWDETELANIVANSYEYAHNPIGCDSIPFEEFVDDAPPKVKKSLFVDGAVLRKRPVVINWLVKDLIETPSAGMIFGDSSVGKTFFTLDLAMSIACGKDWFGKLARGGICVYFLGEGNTGFRRRLDAWCIDREMELPPDRLFVSERCIEMHSSAFPPIRDELRAIMERTGQEISLCIVDTLSRHMPAGMDENSAKDSGEFVKAIDRIKDEFSCAVAILHHCGQADKDRGRGSTAIKGAMDWEIKVSDHKSVRKVEFTKMKEAEKPDDIFFTLRTVDIGGGLSSVVPIRAKYDPDIEKLRGLPKNAQKALDVLLMQDQPATDAQWREAVYTTLRGTISESSLKATYSRAKKDLLDAGTIVCSDKGYSIAPPSGE